MTAALEVRGLTGGYTRASVLRDVHLEVHVGEVVGLLGANGAGKTTLLRAICGALPRSAGDVLIGGSVCTSARPWTRAARGLAHVPEGRHVLGAMTVQENLEVAALLGRTDKISMDEVMELFPRLAERRSQLAASLSGGEQQMLVLSRALLTGPCALVVDEMSAGLAPAISKQLLAALAGLRARGIGMLLVEQNPHLLVGNVDRVYLLEQGRITAHGTLADLGGPDGLAAAYLGVHQASRAG